MGKTITELTAGKQEQRILRLAPYTRVSSNSEDQLHSFAAQVKNYTEYVAEHPDRKNRTYNHLFIFVIYASPNLS